MKLKLNESQKENKCLLQEFEKMKSGNQTKNLELRIVNL